MAQDQLCRNRLPDVVLRDEGLKHRHFRRGSGHFIGVQGTHRRALVDMRRKVSTVAQVAAATHHGQIHTRTPTSHFDGQDVHVFVRGRSTVGFYRLLMQNVGQGSNAVAQLSRFLKCQGVGQGHHLGLHVGDDLMHLTKHEALGVTHVACIVFAADKIHAGPRTAVDLIEQTRPRAIAENGVLAGAQAKHFLHQLNRFAHGPGIGVRAEIAVLAIHRAAKVGYAGETLVGRFGQPVAGMRAGDLQIRIAFVVPKQDVVFGVERLDEVVFKQQGFGLTAHHRGL